MSFLHLLLSHKLNERDVQLIMQCRDITQYLTSSVQELGIGTYISSASQGEDSEHSNGSSNPSHPIYTATMDTTVFDVVHMFSEQGISAVPIVDENGKVLNLYETVDVIVSFYTLPLLLG